MYLENSKCDSVPNYTHNTTFYLIPLIPVIKIWNFPEEEGVRGTTIDACTILTFFLSLLMRLLRNHSWRKLKLKGYLICWKCCIFKAILNCEWNWRNRNVFGLGNLETIKSRIFRFWRIRGNGDLVMSIEVLWSLVNIFLWGEF